MEPAQVGLHPEDRFFVCHAVVDNRARRREREAVARTERKKSCKSTSKNRGAHSPSEIHGEFRTPAAPAEFRTEFRTPAAPAEIHTEFRTPEAPTEIHTEFRTPESSAEIHTEFRTPEAPAEIHTEFRTPAAPAEIHSEFRTGRQPDLRQRRARFALLLTGVMAASTLTTFVFEESAEAQQRRRRLKTTDLTLKGSVAARPLVLVGALAVLSLLPFVIIMVTSFVKISVVLSIVRSAIGTQQIPPTQVITGMAIILTVYIMTPVGLDIYKATENMVQEKRPGATLVSAETVDLIFEAAVEAEGPIKGFLSKNSHLKDRAMFFSMAKRLRKPEDRSGVGPEDLMVLVPSFVISELKEAFQIGFIIFVPFLVIDMIVANILMALGMQMLSPTTISLPFKLLLFVMIDGWYLITKGLITGYV